MDYQTQSQLFYMQEQLRNLSEGYQKMLLTEKQKQEQVAIDKMLENITKINAGVYDKAIAYNNAVLITGYASFFAIWTIAKPILNSWIAITSILLMIFSVTIFVLFEIYGEFKHEVQRC